MYMVRKKKPKTAHIWTGFDTVCRMYSTGGLVKKSYQALMTTDLPICAMCNVNSKKEIRPEAIASKKPFHKVARFSETAVNTAVNDVLTQNQTRG